jgi:hypothetical protein
MVLAFFAMTFAIFALKATAQGPRVDEPKATKTSESRNHLCASVFLLSRVRNL